MEANFDFTNVESGFELLPKGDYPIHLFDVDLKKTQKGDNMYVLILKIAGGEHKGRQLFFNLPVMQQTMWKIKETLEAFGVEVPKRAMKIDFDEMLGSKAMAIVDHREYQGKDREDIIGLKPFEGGSTDDGGDPFAEGEGGNPIEISDDDLPF